MGLDKSMCEFFGGWGGVELWLILLNMGYYTLYEEPYILEIQIENYRKVITIRQFQPVRNYNDLK